MSNIKSTLFETFCLQGLFLDGIENRDNGTFLKVRSPRNSAICPHCSVSAKKVHKKYHRTIKHMICNDKIVFLNLTIRCFKCKLCKYIFRESISGISSKRTSEHFRLSAVKKIKDRCFASVASEYNISSSSLINDAVHIFNNTKINWPDKNFSLGIDEHSFSGRDFVITITDLTNHKLLAILPDDRQTTLRKFLKNIPKNAKDLIISVCTDMKQSYRTVIEKELNKSIHVIDKFHVIQFFNRQLHELRTLYSSHKFPLPKQLLEKNKENLNHEEKKVLRAIFNRYQPLEELWRMKEIIRKMYRCKNPDKAKMFYEAMLEGLQFDNRLIWKSIYKTMNRWKDPILNYFESRITNAYTEGVHTKIKLLKRMSYGFRNKANYIAKMSLAFMPIAALFESFYHQV